MGGSMRDVAEGKGFTFRRLLIVISAVVALFVASRIYDSYWWDNLTPEERMKWQKLSEYERARKVQDFARQVERERKDKARALEQETQREIWEKECADQGLRFTGTIGGKVECRP